MLDKLEAIKTEIGNTRLIMARIRTSLAVLNTHSGAKRPTFKLNADSALNMEPKTPGQLMENEENVDHRIAHAYRF